MAPSGDSAPAAAATASAAGGAVPWECPLTTRADRGKDGQLDVAAAPAPWALKIKRSFALPIWPTAKTLPALRQHLTSNFDRADFLEAGVGIVILVQYESSPAGPYDELLLMPGAFAPQPGPRRTTLSASGAATTPAAPAAASTAVTVVRKGELMADRRITRIYVSTEHSVRNGRRNWGIRKELADFEWTERRGWFTTETHVVVRDRLTQTVMLDATFKSLRVAVPAPLAVFGRMVPAMVERRIDEEGRPLGDNEWLRTHIGGFGWARPSWLASVRQTPGGDGLFPHLPAIGAGVGAGMSGMLVFGAPETLLPAQ
ncbi:hypothetical protein HK105_209252 [Polyrhizophydium stewartii]|uniref:Uncharacterized protein n=1 Tax=Polyrhizophydium stewartii TaxID=2732419 RepID=A0ABR4MVI2_9FUNG|nr:hypothetical protein HK105_004773 [Polyrhizophydium stewartii]